VPGLYSIAKPPEGWERSQRYVGDRSESTESPDGIMWKRWFVREFAVDAATLDATIEEYNSYPGNYKLMSNLLLDNLDEFMGLREKRAANYFVYPTVHLDELDAVEEKRAQVEQRATARLQSGKRMAALRQYSASVPSERVQREDAVDRCIDFLEKYVDDEELRVRTIKSGGLVPSIEDVGTQPLLTSDPVPALGIDPSVVEYQLEKERSGRKRRLLEYSEPQHVLQPGQELLGLEQTTSGILQVDETPQSGWYNAEELIGDENAAEPEEPSPDKKEEKEEDGGVSSQEAPTPATSVAPEDSISSPPQPLTSRKRPAAIVAETPPPKAVVPETPSSKPAPINDILASIRRSGGYSAVEPVGKKSRGTDPAFLNLAAGMGYGRTVLSTSTGGGKK
jgi:GAF domain-containing protein